MGSAHYYIHPQSLEFHVYDEIPNLVNLVLMSLTEFTANHASFMLIARMLWKISMKSIFSN